MGQTVNFVKPNGQLRGYSVIRHDSYPADMRFEVIYQSGPTRYDISWRFFPTRKAAEAFGQESR